MYDLGLFSFLDAGGVEGGFFARTYKCLLRGKKFQANKPTTAELMALRIHTRHAGSKRQISPTSCRLEGATFWVG